MTAYDASQWSDLFVATTGAAAALAGLVFVAVSINIERILAFQGLPERALATVITLVLVVVISVAALVPGQEPGTLGIELLAIACLYALGVIALDRRSLPGRRGPRVWLVSRMVVTVLAVIPLLIGGTSLLAEAGGGLDWVVVAILAAIFGGVANAWVLLVEILR